MDYRTEELYEDKNIFISLLDEEINISIHFCDEDGIEDSRNASIPVNDFLKIFDKIKELLC